MAPVRLRAEAADLAGSVVVGDALSATGRIERDPGDGTVFMAVDDPAGIALVGGLGPDDPDASTSPAASDGPSGAPADGAAPTNGARAPLTAGLTDLGVPEMGALGLILIGLASLAVTLLRRRRMRRRLTARIAERLATLVAASGPALPALATAASGVSPAPIGAGPSLPSSTSMSPPPAGSTDRSIAGPGADGP